MCNDEKIYFFVNSFYFAPVMAKYFDILNSGVHEQGWFKVGIPMKVSFQQDLNIDFAVPTSLRRPCQLVQVHTIQLTYFVRRSIIVSLDWIQMLGLHSKQQEIYFFGWSNQNNLNWRSTLQCYLPVQSQYPLASAISQLPNNVVYLTLSKENFRSATQVLYFLQLSHLLTLD